jgi:hypothetical protein
MNFDDAVSAHTKWKIRLRATLDGTGEKLDSAAVARDDGCELGKWLHGEGTRYKTLGEHQSLVTAHARFHKCAGEVVAKHGQGLTADAEKLLAPGGAFAKNSTETVGAIMAMKRAITK